MFVVGLVPSPGHWGFSKPSPAHKTYSASHKPEDMSVIVSAIFKSVFSQVASLFLNLSRCAAYVYSYCNVLLTMFTLSSKPNGKADQIDITYFKF